MQKRDKQAVAASVTVYRVGDMTAKGRKAVCGWLRKLADDLQNEPEAFAKTFRARHMYPANAAGQDRREATYPEPAGSASPVTQPPRDVSELYHELLYAVARKFPGESRHETALRYIRDTEERVCETGSCKQNAFGERCAVAHTLHPIVGNSELEVR